MNMNFCIFYQLTCKSCYTRPSRGVSMSQKPHYVASFVPNEDNDFLISVTI